MANPTTYFGWVMPNSADLVTDLPADFNVFGQGVDTSMQYLLGGTTGQILSKTSGTNMAFTWINNDQGDITGVTAGTGISGGGTSGTVTVTNSMATAITTNGDIIYGTGSGTFSRLGIGSSAQVLSVSAGIPAWSTPSSGAVVQVKNVTFSTQTIVASSTFADSGLTLAITPTSASNKILVFVTHSGVGKYNSNTALAVRLLRGSTTILNIEAKAGEDASAGENMIGSIAANYIDSPATTSATTYKTQVASIANAGSAYFNDATGGGSNSTITLMEVTP